MTREEAIEIIRKNMPSDKSLPVYEAIQTLIPELAESEDERIRKTLIEALKTSKTVGELKFILPEPTREEAIAYLEKQKPSEWSDTKELVFKDICNHLKEEGYSGWVLLLNALRNGEFQPKQEWSKEDQKNYDDIMSALEESLNANRCYFTSDDVNFLKSLPFKLKKENEGWRHYIWATNLRFDFTALIKYDNTDNYEIVQAGNRPKQEKNGVYILIKDIKPQSHWKPSEEQMEAFSSYIKDFQEKAEAAVGGWNNFDVMIRLYEQLKKL